MIDSRFYCDKDLEKLWCKFSDVPINECECLEFDFHIWKAGTNKYEILEWFDEYHSNGVHYLINRS